MAVELEYHILVNRVVSRSRQRSVPASLGLLGILLLPVFLVSSGFAQIGSANSSSHSVSAAPPTGSIAPPTGGITPPTGAPSVHNGFVSSNSSVPHSSTPFFNSDGHHNLNEHHHPHHTSSDTAVYPYFYGVPVPYADDASDAADANGPDDDDAEYQGGPTVFDRRGSGAASYVPPSYHGPAHAQNQSRQDAPSQDALVAESGADPAPESPQSPTTLVFKDGHQLEVENYAIVAHTLYDLTPGRPRKIALADLDLPATEKQNDDRGVTFQLPPSIQGN
jgi:hypothetical protein